MNILFYLHQFPAFGGIETVTVTWANYLAGEGHAVFIRSHISKETDCTALALASSVRADFMPDASRLVSPANRASLNARVAGSAIDVIVFQDSYARIEGNLADLWGRVPVLVYEHNAPLAPAPRRPPLRFSPRTLARWLLFPYRRRKYARADVLRRQFLYAACARYVLLSNRFFAPGRDWTTGASCGRCRIRSRRPSCPRRPSRRKKSWFSARRRWIADAKGRISCCRPGRKSPRASPIGGSPSPETDPTAPNWKRTSARGGFRAWSSWVPSGT